MNNIFPPNTPDPEELINLAVNPVVTSAQGPSCDQCGGVATQVVTAPSASVNTVLCDPCGYTQKRALDDQGIAYRTTRF